ncbi:epimerase [Lactobacillus sp.] [Lactiplantibacillus mudanjiangensis]|uniref:NAD-dependent epimerase/dehydratase family protein n=1 Tax=Lactiplantibacillus mudanjiangensis TaxID=1296538 RepID=UPI0010159DEF|nr:NAD-dependent epimerase/dehydratase family protein [Lactiplantibacillus mudanjiangensis]VDG32741.1 epimerase [Lactobacillus sp.] [Lactiplantibacillus mudanjiangensis]
MKALVTGGAGFIGSHLVDRLVNQGIEVVVVDDLSMGNIKNIKNRNLVTIYVEDVCNEQFMQRLLKQEKFDYIYFLAAVASVADSIDRPSETHEINHNAVLQTLEFIRVSKLKIKQFLFTSSAAVYGNLPDLPKKETSCVDPISPYAIDKYATERYVLAYDALYNIPTVCVRFFNVYGPGQNPTSPYSGVLSILTDCLKNNKLFTLFGDGLQTRDFIYVEDVIQALWLITESDAHRQVFNVANGREITLNDIIQTYEKIAGHKLSICKETGRDGEVKRSLANIDKLTSLGYSAKWSLKKGLSEYWKGV